jgi:hypothetical protein
VELLVLSELDPVKIVGFFFVLLLCVGANKRFFGSGPQRTASVGGFRRRCCQKARSTRFGWNFFDKDLPVAIAGLLQSWWSLDMFIWFALVWRVTGMR